MAAPGACGIGPAGMHPIAETVPLEVPPVKITTSSHLPAQARTIRSTGRSWWEQRSALPGRCQFQCERSCRQTVVHRMHTARSIGKIPYREPAPYRNCQPQPGNHRYKECSGVIQRAISIIGGTVHYNNTCAHLLGPLCQARHHSHPHRKFHR